jgi:hypothetical protein
MKISFEASDTTIRIEEERQHGLAPVRAVVDLPGALFLDAGHLVPDHNPCGERHGWRILMTMRVFKTISNGNAVPIDSIPLLSFEDFSTPGHGDRFRRRQGGSVFCLPGG